MKNLITKIKNPKVLRVILIVIVAALLIGGFVGYQLLKDRVSIEDSLVQAPIITISPEVAGTIANIKVYEGEQVKKGDDKIKEEVFNFYHLNRKGINNWDLVDLTADRISGAYLFDKDKSLLFKLAVSEDLWERRIAVMSTFHFIKNNSFDVALIIFEKLLDDKHDLIHKAVGWMLREIGNRDIKTEEKFLMKHYKVMPRTMLRYAIEKFPETKRLAYLKGKM